MANYLAKIFKNHNFLSLANNGLVAVFGFFSFIILVRSVPTNEFGEWVLFITTLNFLDMLRFGITRTAIVRFLSGADEEEGNELLGSNYVINLSSTIFLIVIVIAAKFLFQGKHSRIRVFPLFKWFPFIAILNLPFNNALSVLQAKMRFDRILLIRIINVGSFMIFLIVNYFYFQSGILTIMWAYVLINTLSSIIAAMLNWDGLFFILKANKQKVK